MGHSFPFEGLNAMLQGVVHNAPLTLTSMESDHPRIVIVEDDEPTRRFLADNLAADEFEPLEAGNARDGLRLIANHAPALALLDLGLPDRDGLDVLREVRAGEATISRIDPALPVLVLSGRGAEMDRVRGFERGADDYVIKPFSYLELRGRLDAVLRRSRNRPRAGRLRVGPLELDPASRLVRLAGRPLPVSKKEFALLRTLAAEPVRVFTREELLRGVWGYQSIVPTRTLDSHASRLRRKLSDAGAPGSDHQRVGRRLPAARHGDRRVTVITFAGWALAVVVRCSRCAPPATGVRSSPGSPRPNTSYGGP